MSNNEVSGDFALINSKIKDVRAARSSAAIKPMNIKTRIASEFISVSTESDEKEECLCLIRTIEGRIEIIVWETGNKNPSLIQDLGESGTMIPSVKRTSTYTHNEMHQFLDSWFPPQGRNP